jgi:4-hydroxybenzoate polyprenyltransferase/phosphoglycolate phosphatase-like HAD superfamily hydrolase
VDVTSGARSPAIESEQPPLVIDLDGTLIRSDLLVESLFGILAAEPATAWRLPFWLVRGRAALKARIADRTVMDPRLLPVVKEVVELVRAEKALGRRVYIASASDRRLVQVLADHLGLFDGVFGSDGTVNLQGARKAELLCREFGEAAFDYVGDARADLPVWRCARRAIAVNCSPRTLRALRRLKPDATCLVPRKVRLRDYVRALRVHQWAKNALLFLPMLTAHAITLVNLGFLGLAFLAFSLVASSVYLTNDLVDLPADRDHATKRKRPLASGDVPILHGALMAPFLLVAGATLAAAVSPLFFWIVVFYFAVTLSYSLVLKRQPVIDVLTLAGLYTLRVIAGAAALMLSLSAWLLTFSMFLFLCLALVKRHTELKARLDTGKGDPRGRGYLLADIPVLGALAGAAGYSAVVVLALYVNSPAVMALYARPAGLWLICVLLLFWISRILLLTHRGAMHDDPVVFALKDPTSLATAALVAAIAVGSAL